MNFFAFMVPAKKKLFSFFRGLGLFFVYTRVDIVCNKRFNVFWFQKTSKNLDNLHFEFDVTLIYISLRTTFSRTSGWKLKKVARQPVQIFLQITMQKSLERYLKYPGREMVFKLGRVKKSDNNEELNRTFYNFNFFEINFYLCSLLGVCSLQGDM